MTNEEQDEDYAEYCRLADGRAYFDLVGPDEAYRVDFSPVEARAVEAQAKREGVSESQLLWRTIEEKQGPV